MKITVGAFYAGKERFQEFFPYIRASRKALEITNPEAEYVVLSDTETQPLLEKEGFNSFVADNESLPLMVKIIYSQIRFLEAWESDLIILPDVDCLANKRLNKAIPPGVGLAITHKGPKFHYRINNLAYIRDRELGIWFLERALDLLRDFPPEKHHWWGDQEAWENALGVPINGLGSYVVVERLDGEILVARPEKDREIYLYPCATHNCFMPDDGNVREPQKEAFFVHFKGPRKEHLSKWMSERFAG